MTQGHPDVRPHTKVERMGDQLFVDIVMKRPDFSPVSVVLPLLLESVSSGPSGELPGL